MGARRRGWLRRPRTTQERRRYAADAADYGETLLRRRRSNGRLPNVYDDIFPTHSRSWKIWRRTAFKAVV